MDFRHYKRRPINEGPGEFHNAREEATLWARNLHHDAGRTQKSGHSTHAAHGARGMYGDISAVIAQHPPHLQPLVGEDTQRHTRKWRGGEGKVFDWEDHDVPPGRYDRPMEPVNWHRWINN